MSEDSRGWSKQKWPYPNISTGDPANVEVQKYAHFYRNDEGLKRNLARAVPPAEDIAISS